MSNMNRRQFLAAGGFGAAGIALENKAQLLKLPGEGEGGRPRRLLHKYRDPVPTACVGCPARCALVVYREGGRAVQIAPNPVAPVPATTCARAYEALEAVRDPERVRSPLRRVGPRGSGRWEEISWAEALHRITQSLESEEGAAFADLGRPDPLAGLLLGRLGIDRVLEEGASDTWASREAQRAVYGKPLSVPDLEHVQTVLLVSAGPLDGGPHYPRLARDLLEAKARGANIVAVTPYGGATGSLADAWIPVRPGTETLFLLGLARILVVQGWADRESLSEWVGTPGEKLAEALAPYHADLVEAAAGVPALEMVKLARHFADRRPSLCWVDSAGNREAEALEAAAAVLNASGGDPERAGLRLVHRPGWVPASAPTLPRTRAVKEILAGAERASLYLAYRSNPVYWSPRSQLVRRAFGDEGRIGLLVAMDTQITETALLADLVLPAAADLELWNLFGGFTPEGRAYGVLQQPVPLRMPEPELLRSPETPLEALFAGPRGGPARDARQLGDVLLELLTLRNQAEREQFPFPDAGAYVRHLADSEPSLAAAGGFEALGRAGTWVSRFRAYPWAGTHGFPTPSGLLEVAGRLVHRVPGDLKRLEGGVFALVPLRYPELGPGYTNTRWGREIRRTNPVYMNSAVARDMGLSRGARVVIRTQVGEAFGVLEPLEGIHPQAVAIAEDFGHWAGGVAATASGDVPAGPPIPGADTEPVWWEDEGPGFSIRSITPFTSDLQGAQAWRDLRVTVHPA